jgi:D-alanine transaminase
MVDDKIMPFEQLDKAYLDRGLYFGDGVYEVLRSYDGRIFALEEHLRRFANSLAAIEITGVDIADIRPRVTGIFEKAGIANAKIYFHVTRGSEPRYHKGGKDLKPNFLLTICGLPDDTKAKTNGIIVSTYPDLRWKRCDIKSLNLLPNIMAVRDAAKKGCDEAILVDDKGFITEGSGSAFFAVRSGELCVSPLAANILPSITRGFVLRAAGDIGMKVVEKQFTTQQAIAADELLIGVTTRDVVPVVKFDGHIIGDGKPGKYTNALACEFRKFTK